MTISRFTRVVRTVFFTAVALVSLFLGGIVCLMCQVLAGRDAPTFRVDGHIVSHEQGALPVGGDEDAVSHTIAVDAGNRLYRVTAVGPDLDLPAGQPVALDVSTADGSLICAALLALGAIYFGAVRLNVYPPVATWLALALGALLAPVAVFVRV
jgi:hypothetical protein